MNQTDRSLCAATCGLLLAAVGALDPDPTLPSWAAWIICVIAAAWFAWAVWELSKPHHNEIQ